MSLSRRSFLKSVGAGALMTAGLGKAFAVEAGTRKPNIIYILADDMGIGDAGCYGQDQIQTPNIDRLAAEGMRFTQHYSGSTVCAPSRCVLMTGRHTGHCRIRGNRNVPLAPEDLTVAELLKKAGYATGGFGKWGLGESDTTGAPLKKGFDTYYGYLNQSWAHYYYPEYLMRDDKREEIPGNDHLKRQGTYSQDLIAEETLTFIRANKDKPFFAYVPFTTPHAEMIVPDDSMAQYRGTFPETPYVNKNNGHGYCSQSHPRAAYAAMISRMDGDIGRILKLLKELKIDEDTIVLFSSDNGVMREGGYDGAFFDSNGPYRGYKRDLYEGGIHVPFVVRWPGRIKAGSVSDHISDFSDFLPTCAELAGAACPEGMDGISYLPTLQGQNEKQKKHTFLYWEFYERGGKQAVRMGNWKGVRLEVVKNPDNPIELYDLSVDRAEQNNVAADNPIVVKIIEKVMEKAHTPSRDFMFSKPKKVIKKKRAKSLLR